MTIALIGIGNVLLQDERVGVHVVETIRERFSFSPEIEILDGGTLGLDLLPTIERLEKVLFVDAVNFGKEPGYIGMLEDDEIPAVLYVKLSVHHVGLADLLSVAKLTGVIPKKVCLLGIQPQDSAFAFGLELSEHVRDKIDILIDQVISKLQEWNVQCVLRSPQK
ncbi:MAG: hydrogenase 1 maturation protease [Nitrospirae bacterium]|nr:MAG: hydrogenase 1 maturation protease [Nitrospirota bacterium]